MLITAKEIFVELEIRLEIGWNRVFVSSLYIN